VALYTVHVVLKQKNMMLMLITYLYKISQCLIGVLADYSWEKISFVWSVEESYANTLFLQ